MTIETRERTAFPRRKIATRRDLSELAIRICGETGARFYLIAEATSNCASGHVRILASNWTFDTIEDIGLAAITRLVESPVATFPGTDPCPWHPQALAALLASEEIGHLGEHGHQEIFPLKLPAGKSRYVALISGEVPGAVDTERLAAAQLHLSHTLSGLERRMNDVGEALSERERECLFWVSEGKTADEVSLIISVSANTVNSYVAHAIHKLAANNRAMAIATAIRRGII
ncbi:helix-turn-helix transcriptional regulator [Nitratireductor indicus]|uniref:LuxR family transcriptional regulator n=1 Tax=Nitratireductor indicus C115 TaxID=1231190 RepID=K2P2G5_9HYPH|nr:helix-turn-helix transcriptional regulator [Nitratireductor indicus]EKF41551.1 LuxR family transcriptional regulator [Nitratireductor indicus C115]MDS1136079.1 helix-turn-helix transcriptional regulator [Nitratireductor indicus]SFQ69968.1 DNA-binding transcriptional regulator, CsgD family [Nitratireductor indicus]